MDKYEKAILNAKTDRERKRAVKAFIKDTQKIIDKAKSYLAGKEQVSENTAV